MKEVEFRAWDLKDKRMYHNVGIVGTLIILEHEQSGYEFCELELKSYDHIDNNYVLMQYTGTKDTNGVKIFEGDILKVPEYYEHQENQTMPYLNWEVTYENCAFRLDGISMEEDYEWISAECEVIGNIYENKELLKN